MIHLLVGANHFLMRRWCFERLMHHSEIGRTVFSTRLHRYDDRLFRGHNEFIDVIGLDDDGRPFAHQHFSYEGMMIDEARTRNMWLEKQ